MNKLKIKVADSEELWLEFFQTAIEHTLDKDIVPHADAVIAGGIADRCLEEYERRWGNGGTKVDG